MILRQLSACRLRLQAEIENISDSSSKGYSTELAMENVVLKLFMFTDVTLMKNGKASYFIPCNITFLIYYFVKVQNTPVIASYAHSLR